MTRFGVLLLAVALTCLAPLTSTAGVDRALLIGVGDYHPSVTAIAPPLNGPGNDVMLMRQILLDTGLPQDRIRLLTTQGPHLPPTVQTELPTRARILAAMEHLAETVGQDENILIYFAGHGSQVPANNSLEPDALDEVFLPSDFRITKSGTPENAIRDDTLGAYLDRLIGLGANVWLVADTCHSGSLRRGDAGSLVPRQLTLWAEPQGGASLASDLPALDQGTGQFVAFYGAQVGRLAFEGRPQSDGSIHGLLTWALAKAIRTGARDYRGLAQLTQANMWQASAGRAAPAFNGALATQPMLGADRFSHPRYPMHVTDDRPPRIVISAGELDGLTENTPVAIGWADGPDLPLITARVTQMGLAQAALTVPAFGDPAAAALDDHIRREGLDPVRFRGRWLASRAPSLTVWPIVPVAPPDLNTVAARLENRRVSLSLQADLSIQPSLADGCPTPAPVRALGKTRVVHHCDQVDIHVHNQGSVVLDITPLYLSPDNRVYFLPGYPGSQAGGLRLAPGAQQTIRYVEDLSPVHGQQPITGEVTIVLLAVEAMDLDHPPVDFRYLQEGPDLRLRAAAHQTRDLEVQASGAVRLHVTTQAEPTKGQTD